VPEFQTTVQGCRLATSVGGGLTGRGADMIIHRWCAGAREGKTQRRAPTGDSTIPSTAGWTPRWRNAPRGD